MFEKAFRYVAPGRPLVATRNHQRTQAIVIDIATQQESKVDQVREHSRERT